MTTWRTKGLTTKLTPDEWTTIARAAAGQPLSEWVRAALLAAAAAPRADHVLLAEVLALRAIVLNLQVAAQNGDALTTEHVQRLIERADADTLRKAQTRLASAANGRIR